MVLRHFKFAVFAALFLGCTSFDWNANSNDENSIVKGASGTFTDERDNTTYKWIEIGSQRWMAENLNYATTGGRCYGEGGKVEVPNDECTSYECSSTKEIMLTSEEIQANCAKYGRLYNWATAMGLPSNCNSSACTSQIADKRQGICPSGWHISNTAEWVELAKFVGGTGSFNVEGAGSVLKAKDGWVWDGTYGKSGNGTDSYGFSALPSGAYVNYVSTFSGAGSGGIWWTANENSTGADIEVSEYAYTRSISYQGNAAGLSNGDKNNLYSIRCLMD